MNDNPQAGKDLTDEFVALGKNLMEAMRAAWNTPERKRAQQEIEEGFSELGKTLKREAEYFASSPTGQQLHDDMQDLGERLRSGQAQEKARQEVLSVLQTANNELQKLINQWSASETQDTGGEAAPTEPPKTE